MHRLIVITSIVLAGAHVAGCGSRGESEATSTTTMTSARAQADDRSFEDRIATAICVHEVECGRGQPASCVDQSRDRTRRELGAWTCDPAAARAAAEQCLAAIRAESCSVDLLVRTNVCPLNGGCANVETISPGPEAAEIWRR